MKEEDIYNIIEKIYNEKRDIQNSKEYKLGNKINKTINNLKNRDFKTMKERLYARHILKKYKDILQVKLNKNEKRYKLFLENKKVVVYTCITGNYDDTYDPIIKEEKCKYILYTNNNKLSSDVFEIREIPNSIVFEKDTNIMINRYIKFHPFELFGEDYDYSIYIDGNIRIISNITSLINEMDKKLGIAMHKHCARNCLYDEANVLKLWKKGNVEKIDEQVLRYKKEGFPINYGLAEANIIITDLKNKTAKEIFKNWWNEFLKSNSLRDQLAFPYIIWKMNIDMNNITTLGNNVYDNPKIERIRHKE